MKALKPPYEVRCKCGYKFIVSHSVVRRLLNCPSCGLAILYERNLKGDNRKTYKIGKFKTEAERERRLNDYAHETCPDLLDEQKPSPGEESSGLPAAEGSDINSVNGSKDLARSVLPTDQGVFTATGAARGAGKEAGKGRVAGK